MRSEGNVFVLHANNRIEPLEAQDYEAEELLQILSKEHPEVLAGEQISPDDPRRWLLVTREMAAPRDRRAVQLSIDHLFLDQDGVPSLVQIKRSSNIGTRRELVGHMLEYAATLADRWPAHQIRSRFEEDRAAKGDCARTALEEFLGLDGDAVESSVDDFWQQVERNLRTKRLRLLFVADSIPTRLRGIVEFLNEVMHPTEVLAVEIRQFKGHGITALVPRVIGQTEARRRRKHSGAGREASDKAMFMNSVRSRSQCNGNVPSAVEELLAWAKLSGLELEVERARPSPRCSIRLPGAVALLRIVNHAQCTSLVLPGLQGLEPFDSPEVRTVLHQKLTSIPGFTLKSDGTAEWPAMDLSKVVEENRLIDLISVVDWIVEEWRACQDSEDRASSGAPQRETLPKVVTFASATVKSKQ